MGRVDPLLPEFSLFPSQILGLSDAGDVLRRMPVADEDGDRRPPLCAVPPGDRADRGGLAGRAIRDRDTGVIKVLCRAGRLTGRAGIRLDLLRPGAGGAQEGEGEAREDSDVRFSS